MRSEVYVRAGIVNFALNQRPFKADGCPELAYVGEDNPRIGSLRSSGKLSCFC
jgi:hypothetical protein